MAADETQWWEDHETRPHLAQMPGAVLAGLDEIREKYKRPLRQKIENRARAAKAHETRRQRSDSRRRGTRWGRTPGREAVRTHEAEDFLREVLKDGPRPVAEVVREGKPRGVSRDRLYCARSRIGVVSERIPGTRRSAWRLPDCD